MEKARPHPNLLPQEKEFSRAVRCAIESSLAHDSLCGAHNTMAAKRCSRWGEGGPLTDRAATLMMMTRPEQKLSGSLATVPRCAQAAGDCCDRIDVPSDNWTPGSAACVEAMQLALHARSILDPIKMGFAPEIERFPGDCRGCHEAAVEFALAKLLELTARLQHGRFSIVTEKVKAALGIQRRS